MHLNNYQRSSRCNICSRFHFHAHVAYCIIFGEPNVKLRGRRANKLIEPTSRRPLERSWQLNTKLINMEDRQTLLWKVAIMINWLANWTTIWLIRARTTILNIKEIPQLEKFTSSLHDKRQKNKYRPMSNPLQASSSVL